MDLAINWLVRALGCNMTCQVTPPTKIDLIGISDVVRLTIYFQHIEDDSFEWNDLKLESSHPDSMCILDKVNVGHCSQMTEGVKCIGGIIYHPEIRYKTADLSTSDGLTSNHEPLG